MSDSKKKFLRDLFSSLNQANIPYCVSRNVMEIFQDTSSDIDLIVPNSSTRQVETLCEDIAKRHSFQRIARIQFTNLCLVYWSAADGFVRLDLDTELRWSICEIATSTELLTGRYMQNGVMVIAPKAELWVMADRLVWMKGFTPRYAQRVRELLSNTSPFDTYSTLTPSVTSLLQQEDFSGLRRFLVKRLLRSPQYWIKGIRYFYRDLRRFVERMIAPPGVLIQDSSPPSGLDWLSVFQCMSLAFPLKKSVLSDKSFTKIVKALFRGGIAVVNGQPSFLLRMTKWFAHPDRNFSIKSDGQSLQLALQHSPSIPLNDPDLPKKFAMLLTTSLVAQCK